MSTTSGKRLSVFGLAGVVSVILALLLPAYATIFWGIAFASVLGASLVAAEKPDPAHATRTLALSLAGLILAVIALSALVFNGVI